MDSTPAHAALGDRSAQVNDLRAVFLAIASILGFFLMLDSDEDPNGLGLLAARIGSFGLVADVVLTVRPT